jgi:hypothetical protein
MSEITIDAETTEQISFEDAETRTFNKGFLNFLKKNQQLGVGHYGYDSNEQVHGPQFVVDGKFTKEGTYIEGGRGVEYDFDDGLLILDGGEDGQKVADAIRAYINRPKKVKKASEPAEKASEPAEKASEPPRPRPSFVDKFRGRVAESRKATEGTGGRKTRAKKEPKRKTRKAKKSTRRR